MDFMLRSAKERRVYPGLGLQIGRTWARALGTGIRWLERQLACWGVAGGWGGGGGSARSLACTLGHRTVILCYPP